jgi:sensor histidine kinase regulating citrate/malate metabolism
VSTTITIQDASGITITTTEEQTATTVSMLGTVFTNAFTAVQTFAAMEAAATGVTPILFIVAQDETNGNQRTFYLYDGTNINWLVTQQID